MILTLILIWINHAKFSWIFFLLIGTINQPFRLLSCALRLSIVSTEIVGLWVLSSNLGVFQNIVSGWETYSDRLNSVQVSV